MLEILTRRQINESQLCWKAAVQILVHKAHVYNKRLAASIVYDDNCQVNNCVVANIRDLFDCTNVVGDVTLSVARKLVAKNGSHVEHDCVMVGTSHNSRHEAEYEWIVFIPSDSLSDKSDSNRMASSQIVPTHSHTNAQTLATDPLANNTNAVRRLSVPFIYGFALFRSSEAHRYGFARELVSFAADGVANTASSAIAWIKDNLMSRFSRWLVSANNCRITVQPPDEDGVTSDTSLALVDIQKYALLYAHLRSKHTLYLLEIWSEKTDPLKFIHEDLAIAAYLITLWNQEPSEESKRDPSNCKQKFVDLGCGNGLLVYILNAEGYAGYGIDVRKRKIWDLYVPKPQLLEQSMYPTADWKFPACDWLLGNHSDELTPWIPVAAGNTNSTRFFLLPCCAWDFYGKFQRTNTAISQYADYLDYVHAIADKCGFIVECDRLRIPSTKRRCLIGRHRSRDHDRRPITQMLAANEAGQFTPRSAIQPIRNCTQIDRAFREQFVTRLANHLLLCEPPGDGTAICDVARSLTCEERDVLRSQHGGLQTLLRNHGHIFRVRGGRVHLQPTESRVRRAVDETRARNQVCWFDKHSPSGCGLSADRCRFLHSSVS